MSKVIKLSDHAPSWKEVFAIDSPNTTLQVYVNTQTGETEIVQMNDDNEAIRTPLEVKDVDSLITALVLAMNKRVIQ